MSLFRAAINFHNFACKLFSYYAIAPTTANATVIVLLVNDTKHVFVVCMPYFNWRSFGFHALWYESASWLPAATALCFDICYWKFFYCFWFAKQWFWWYNRLYWSYSQPTSCLPQHPHSFRFPDGPGFDSFVSFRPSPYPFSFCSLLDTSSIPSLN